MKLEHGSSSYERMESMDIKVIGRKVTVTEDPAPIPGSVSIPERLTLTVGETSALAAVPTPENQAVTWSSSQPSVAAVDSTGKVTAKAAGDAVITAEITVDGQKYTDTCAVKVSAKPVAHLPLSECEQEQPPHRE